MFFEGFIINARMCYINAYEREHQSYSFGDGISGRGCPLQTTSTTEAL